MTPLYTATIPGRCIVKKNTKNIVGRGRSRRAYYTPNFVAWHEVAMASLLGAKNGPPIDGRLTATFDFYFANRMAEADVSNLVEGPQDALVKAGVIIDDKQFDCTVARKHFGEEARVEISIYRNVKVNVESLTEENK